jgi:hypothetical protein
MLLCTNTVWTSLESSQIDTLLSGTIDAEDLSSTSGKTPSIARPTGGLLPSLREIGNLLMASGPTEGDISPFAVVESAIKEIQTLAQREALSDRELFERSKKIYKA